MQIDPSKPISAVGGTGSQAPSRVAQRPTDSVSFARSARMQEAYREVPDVRLEKVELGKELLKDGSYPPPEALLRLSRLLAIDFAPSKPE